MIKTVILALLCITILSISEAGAAGKWKQQNYKDSKIELRMDWSWATTKSGEYWETWSDDYTVRLISGQWKELMTTPFPIISILVERTAPGRFWTKHPVLDEKALTWWYALKEAGVGNIREKSCSVGNCVAFETGQSECVAFSYLLGKYVQGTTAGPGESGDMVSGYYCSGSTQDISAETLETVLRAIVI